MSQKLVIILQDLNRVWLLGRESKEMRTGWRLLHITVEAWRWNVTCLHVRSEPQRKRQENQNPLNRVANQKFKLKNTWATVSSQISNNVWMYDSGLGSLPILCSAALFLIQLAALQSPWTSSCGIYVILKSIRGEMWHFPDCFNTHVLICDADSVTAAQCERIKGKTGPDGSKHLCPE